MANVFNSAQLKNLNRALLNVILGLALFVLPGKCQADDNNDFQPQTGLESNVRPFSLQDKPHGQLNSFINSQIKELAGKILVDAQLEVTQPQQIDKYMNFVNVTTPTLTPASGHSLLFSNSTSKAFVAKFSDGSTQVLGGSSGVGTITGVTAGLGLVGGGTTGTVTLFLSTPITSSYIPDYISGSSVTATYLQQSSATLTYLQLSSATATYLKLSSATATYLQLSSATATYPVLVGGLLQNSQVDGSSITKQGNTFNGNSQLVLTTSGGLLPALSGVNLTALNASNLASGTVADARLSANVGLLNTTSTWSAQQKWSNSAPSTFTALAVTGLTASRCVQTDSNGLLTSASNACSSATGYQTIKQTFNNTSSSTTSSSFQVTPASVTITPSSSSSRIRVCVHGSGTVDSSGTTEEIGLFRNASELDGANFAEIASPAAASMTVPVGGCHIDSPATTSATSYTIRIRSSNNSTNVRWCQNSDAAIQVEEIQ